MIEVQQLKEVSESVLKDMNMLLPALSDMSKRVGTKIELEKITNNPDIILIVAQEDEKIVGMGMLFLMQKLGKKKAFMEDVVVADSQRGKGLGKTIVEKLIDVAKKREVNSIELTSNEKRVAANGLYLNLGFNKRITNVFTMNL